MLISFNEINKILIANNINITGAFHIGVPDCEELKFYNKIGLKNKNIIWIDAIPINFNNIQSSNIFDFKINKQPSIIYINKIYKISSTIDTFFTRNNIEPSKYNFLNFDIHGAELLALKDSIQNIKYAKAIYFEINENKLSKNCGLINEIDTFLNNYNFVRVLTKTTRYGWGDALYISK